MSEKITYQLTLSYEGSYFKGWHTQVNVPTVQGILNKVLEELYGEKIFMWGAGRTDSGAHALKYTAHFRTKKNTIPQDKIKNVLNSKLPPKIRIYDVQEQSHQFHATFSCIARSYVYVIYIGEVLPPHLYSRVYHERSILDISSINRTLLLFRGTHNFEHFCYGYTKNERQKKSMNRHIDYFYAKNIGPYILFFIKGEGFLRGMIRTLIGVSLSVSKGLLSDQDIKKSLDGTPLPQGFWQPVPAEGLYFKRAHY